MQTGKLNEPAPPGRAEQISSLIDGELDEGLCGPLFATLCQDEQARSAWVRMHLVADALHSNEVAACHSERFCARVSVALQSEPTVLAPRASGRRIVGRYVVPGLALAAAVAAISFGALPLLAPGVPESAGSVAGAEPTVAAQVASGDSMRRAAATVAHVRSLDPYLAAHRELTSTGVALPRATPYLRPVADQGQGR